MARFVAVQSFGDRHVVNADAILYIHDEGSTCRIFFSRDDGSSTLRVKHALDDLMDMLDPPPGPRPALAASRSEG